MADVEPTTRPVRVGSVSYLNAKPLVYGLDTDTGISLSLEVPALLLKGMRELRYDVALLPVIDYQRLPGLTLLAAGGIASDGSALTVRLFSKRPLRDCISLACDIESHTSVALAQVVLHHMLGSALPVQDFAPARDDMTEISDDSALLLIGDKVVCEAPTDRPYQLDLGQAWKEMTGLPFVFAAWTAQGGVQTGDVCKRLARARIQGMEHVDEIVTQFALPRGWPKALARAYLTQYLEYELTPPHLEAVELFHKLSGALGLIGPALEPLRVAK